MTAAAFPRTHSNTRMRHARLKSDGNRAVALGPAWWYRLASAISSLFGAPRMNNLTLALSICFLLPLLAYARHGSAENGYYPMGFHGDTWTGVVSATDDPAREITLVFTKGSKTETFIGVLEQGHKVKSSDGTPHVLKASEIPLGTRLKVYYIPRERQVEGRKVTFNEIFRLVSVKA